MKKILKLILAATLLVSLAGCGGAKATVTVGLDENFPPMGFRDDKGNLTGFDIDMANEAAKKMGTTITFQPIAWSAKELELSSKKVDMLWNGLTITDERKEKMLFSAPYLKNKQIIVVKNDSGISTKADLAGKTIGIQKESSAVDAVNSDTSTKESLGDIVEYDDNIMAFQDLQIGRISAVVLDEIVARYYLAHNETPFTILEDNFGDEEYGVGMRLDDTELQAKLQKALDEMNADGTAAAISKKWFGEDIVIKN